MAEAITEFTNAEEYGEAEALAELDITQFLTDEGPLLTIMMRARMAGYDIDQRQTAEALTAACLDGRVVETHSGNFALSEVELEVAL